MNRILKISSLSIIVSSLLNASGWRIPEQDATSIALSGAYIANSNKASSSYYNPANMSFNDNNKTYYEISVNHIHLDSIKYVDSRSSAYNGDSETENFLIPTFFLSSAEYDGFRFGLSVTTPGGLSKRWNDTFPKTSAQEFSLKIVELNPVISYKINDQFAVAGGFRTIYSEGIVKSDGYIDANHDGAVDTHVARDMNGDTVEYGYNLALAYKPNSNTNLTMTYRSNVNITEDGNAKLYKNHTLKYNGGVKVTVPLPAVLTLAYSQKISKVTFELTYDKTYWSKYKNLDFEYDTPVTDPVLKAAFDDPKAKDWSDTNAYRLGITYNYSNHLDLMLGYAIDENPQPTQHVGFELPDSDAKIYSLGLNYRLKDNANIAFGYLYDDKENRNVVNTAGKIDGEFSNASATMISFAYTKEF